MQVGGVLAAKVTSREDLESVAKWALENGHFIKAFGSMHNWSPLILSEDEPKDKALLLDMSQFNHLEMLESHADYGVVKAGCGLQSEDLYSFLANQPGGQPDIPGYAFSNTPALSATTDTQDANLNTVVWLDLLTFADMPWAGEFYQEVEEWLYQQLPAHQVRVEWSKGWGYIATGAWKNEDFIANTVPTTFSTATRSYEETAARLREYDPHYLFASSLVRKLVP
ncbi:cholesterol oxidase substrate-binding domain-containing protein [Enterovibrio norvegicus]|uniref:cholesterol oxidase substrate-binding domain-containing protein n=1 Tax=Enterovibrio norvegicus TaxID=188144 RepID=UPI003CC8340E